MPRSARPAPGSPSTADQAEVARFSALAQSWWDPEGEFKPLHAMMPARLEFVRRALIAHFGRDETALRPFEGLSLLDIGCGGGLMSEPMTRMGFRVTGIDASAEGIGTARAHAAEQGLKIDYRQATPEDLLPEDLLPEAPRFDVVLAMEIVEHVADLEAFLGAAAALTKPEGAFLAATLNRTPKSFAMAILGAEYLLRWLPVGTHDWKKFVRPSEFARHLGKGGIAVKELAGMGYAPLTGEWILTKDLDVNYLLYGARRL